MLRPFVFRRYIDFSVIQSLRNMRMIAAVRRRGLKDNIKLGAGGIREVSLSCGYSSSSAADASRRYSRVRYCQRWMLSLRCCCLRMTWRNCAWLSFSTSSGESAAKASMTNRRKALPCRRSESGAAGTGNEGGELAAACWQTDGSYGYVRRVFSRW